MLTQEELIRTDYLTETLLTEKQTQLEVFKQMLYLLELRGDCRFVYHRLGNVLFDDGTKASTWHRID